VGRVPGVERRLRDLDANEAGADLYREMVRRVIDDPDTAEGPLRSPDRASARSCTPTTTRRSNRPRDAGRPPARHEEITPTGIHTAQGEYELDMIVYATGSAR
jgi:hypothetical protein